MDKGGLKTTVIAVAVLAVLLIGEVSTFTQSPNTSADVDEDGNWEISSKGKFTYDVISFDQGDVTVSDRVVIYQDKGYGTAINKVLVEVGARQLDQDYYLQQLRYNLGYLGVKEIEMVDAQGLVEIMNDSSYAKCCIVMTSGAFPDTVYDGTSGSKVLKWISNGGSLYWVSMQIGRYIGHSDGNVTEVPAGYERLFLGRAGCLNPMEQNSDLRGGAAYSDVTDNNLRHSLSLKNNNILYAVDTDAMEKGSYLAAGYCEDIDGKIYTSTVYVRNGNGQVCIMAGDYSNHQRMDMSSLIAQGITCTSEIIGWCHGTQNGRVSGIIDTGSEADMVFYVQVGGDFATFGQIYRNRRQWFFRANNN